MDLGDLNKVQVIKSNMHATFDTPVGKEVLEFIEQLCSWTPSILDSNDTNDIISRDATRKVCGTIHTILRLSPDQIVALATGGEDA